MFVVHRVLGRRGIQSSDRALPDPGAVRPTARYLRFRSLLVKRPLFAGISMLISRPTDKLYVPASDCNASISFLIARSFRRLRENAKAQNWESRTLFSGTFPSPVLIGTEIGFGLQEDSRVPDPSNGALLSSTALSIPRLHHKLRSSNRCVSRTPALYFYLSAISKARTKRSVCPRNFVCAIDQLMNATRWAKETRKSLAFD